MQSDFPHHQAAFINAITEEGTKAEACEWLQKTWNELCELKKTTRAPSVDMYTNSALSIHAYKTCIETLEKVIAEITKYCESNDGVIPELTAVEILTRHMSGNKGAASCSEITDKKAYDNWVPETLEIAIKEVDLLREEIRWLNGVNDTLALKINAMGGHAKARSIITKHRRDSELKRESGTQWQPIETCPDNSEVLVHGIGGTHVALMSEGMTEKGEKLGQKLFIGQTYGDCKPAVYKVTHWMPLPKPPLTDVEDALSKPGDE